MPVERYSQKAISEDLGEKMVFLSGPRQVGKTTLANALLRPEIDVYYNWDRREDRRAILSAHWPATESTVVLDELHKYARWKSWIKGQYDTCGQRIHFLITGSARLDIYRKGGDSLQGRYHAHRLHGFSLGETLGVRGLPSPGQELTFPAASGKEEGLKALFRFGPFPEPFLRQDERSLRRWQKERMDRFFREDVRDLESVRDLSAIELLADMLADRVGSLLSIQSLREDLDSSHKAVTHWMDILERLYYCFRISPFAHGKIRALKKAQKAYLWDWSLVSDEAARFENLIAGHLLKLKHALEDQEGYDIGLHYLKTADHKEVDFLMTEKDRPWFAVECKMSDRAPSQTLRYFGDRLGIPYLFQITMEGGRDVMAGPIRIMPARKFLAALP